MELLYNPKNAQEKSKNTLAVSSQSSRYDNDKKVTISDTFLLCMHKFEILNV